MSSPVTESISVLGRRPKLQPITIGSRTIYEFCDRSRDLLCAVIHDVKQESKTRVFPFLRSIMIAKIVITKEGVREHDVSELL